MFIGHFALGFAAKKAAPAVSLGTLFLAAQFIDLLWPTLLLLGIERVEIDPGNTVVTPLNFVHYPVSHSLVAVALWACVLAALYMLIRRSVRGALVIGLLVVSHWILDLVTHRPDLPILPGGPVVRWSDLGCGTLCPARWFWSSACSPWACGFTCAPRSRETARGPGRCGAWSGFWS